MSGIKINGNEYDWSSVRIKIRGKLIDQGISAIKYKNAREPKKVEASGAQASGRTRGTHKAEASITMLMSTYYELLAELVPPGSSKGYMEVPFDIVVQWAEANMPVITDEIPGACIVEDPTDGKHGGEAMYIDVKLDIFYVKRDGRMPLDNMRQ